MNAVVGYTGFVGSNIYGSGEFEAGYNSSNIEEAFGTGPDLLVFTGLPAEKYLANSDPEKDLLRIKTAESNIAKIAPKKLVLISTIDVFRTPRGVDETAEIDTEGLEPYGYDRLMLEKWAREEYPDALIVRLPALFGKNIKKNFIYDYMNVIPFMLKEAKFEELSGRAPVLRDYYERADNGFYRAAVPDGMKEEIKDVFRSLGFSALNFTDSRSVFQFYDLGRLWDDIQTALAHRITLLHPATEPVSAAEVYRYLTGEEFVNELGGDPAFYDYRTVHDSVFGGSGGYICGKEQVMAGIKDFVTGRAG